MRGEPGRNLEGGRAEVLITSNRALELRQYLDSRRPSGRWSGIIMGGTMKQSTATPLDTITLARSQALAKSPWDTAA